MNYLRKSYEIIGYAYDADLHCLECTLKRFPLSKSNLSILDFEGNEVCPVFLGDEFDTPPVCGDCLVTLD